MTSNQDSFDKAEQPSGASQPRLQKNTNALRDHWQNDVLPRLTPEIVYTDPSHRFQISQDRWRGGSPFRESKSGTSFAVWPSTLRFYDSGMGFAGDPISYIHSLKVGRWEHPKGKDWVEALRELSRIAGVEHLFPERSYSAQQVERAKKWEERRGIFAAVYTLCAEYLWSEQGVTVRSHLTEKRGFTENQLRDLKIGLYPTTALVEGTLGEQGFNIELALECGVLTRKWEGYVIFPWLTPHAEPLTMYGHWPASKADIPLKKDCPGWKKERDTAWKAWNKLTQAQKTENPWLEPQIPKKYACWNPKDESGSWLSTKESPLYFDRVLKARHTDVVLVEGVTDAALAQSYGDTKVIACVAASLSKEQVQTLSRYRIERVNICLDPDLAGDKGIISCIKSLQAAGITPYVAPCLPKDSDGDGDPDRFIIKYGIEAWKHHTNFDNATHGFRWMARQIIATHGQENEELSDAIRETILREASLFTSSVERQHSEALATYFWPQIKQAVGTIQIIPTASDAIPVVASSTVSLLRGNDNSGRGGNSRRNNSNSRASNNSHRKQNNGGDSGGGTNDGSSYNDEPWGDNDWDAPQAWNGEIGKWYKEDDGTFKFKPLTDFDFIITGEVMAAPGSDTGGGYLVKIKRSFESTEKEIFLKSLECISVKDFTTAINQKFGVHLSCRLSQCPTLNEGLTGLNSVTDFFDKLPALMSSNYVGSWNAEAVESREYGKVLALHLPSIWTEFDRQFSPAYNRPILERVLADMGAIKNKSAKLHSDRDQVLAYQRALLTVRYDDKGDAIFPNPPERINKKCLFVPERLWKSLNLDWLLEDDEPDDPSPGGGSPYNSPDPNDGNPSSGSPHSQTDIPDANSSSSNQDSDRVTHSHQPLVTSYNLEQQSISPALSFASHQVTACSQESDLVTTRSCIPSEFFKQTNFLALFVEYSFLVTLVTLSALTLLSLDSSTFEESPIVGNSMVTSCETWVTCFRSGKLTQNYSSQLERLISASCKKQYVYIYV